MVARRFPEAPAPDISVRAVAYPADAATAEELVERLTGKPANVAAA